MSFTAEYSLWFTLLCLLLAAAGTWFLYRTNTLDLSGKYANLTRWLLSGFRFLSIFIISFLLLGPLVKYISSHTEKPVVVIAIDGSESVVSNKDSVFYKTTFVESINRFQENLANDFEVTTYTVGKTITKDFNGSFTEKQTNLSQVFDELKNNFGNQNLGAVVLATDGLYNDGSNPVYPAKDLKAPVFTIALGDTQQQKDVLIKQVNYNQLVYSGNLFPLQIDISAFGFSNKQVLLSVSHNGKAEFSAPVVLNESTFFRSVPVTLEANKPGTQHYIISISSLPGEVSLANNRFDVFINVIDGKQKVALVYFAPHPDITAYKNSIEQNENYSLKAISYDKISAAELNEYSLILFHQLPGLRGEGLNLVKAAADQHLPALYILGAQTGLTVLNAAVPAINIQSNRNATNEVLPGIQTDFSLFTLANDELEIIKKFPPLYAPYGNYKITVEHDVLFTQQIGYVKTGFPLIAFGKAAGNKTGFICGEGFWKWQLYDAALSNQRVSTGLMGKIVQYLAAKDDRSRFRMNSKKRFDESEPVSFDAELYNESYELINTGDISLEVKNAAGKKFPYTFSKTTNAYTLNIGLMPVGNYTYEATTAVGSKLQKLRGEFAVIPLQVEFLQTTANHQLLNELSSETRGALFYPQDLDKLEKAIHSNETIKPVTYKQNVVKSWINLKWIFFLVLGLLSVEWFVRKWNGSI